MFVTNCRASLDRSLLALVVVLSLCLSQYSLITPAKAEDQGDSAEKVTTKQPDSNFRAPIFHEAGRQADEQNPTNSGPRIEQQIDDQLLQGSSFEVPVAIAPIAEKHYDRLGFISTQDRHEQLEPEIAENLRLASDLLVQCRRAMYSERLKRITAIDQGFVESRLRNLDSAAHGEEIVDDLNNYLPDAFNADEVTALFQLNERVRQEKEFAQGIGVNPETGKPLNEVSPPAWDRSLDRIRLDERQLRESYTKALAGVGSFSRYEPRDVELECAICRESLVLEPTVELSCGHYFHGRCIAMWDQKRSTYFSPCPRCRTPYRLPLGWPQKIIE